MYHSILRGDSACLLHRTSRPLSRETNKLQSHVYTRKKCDEPTDENQPKVSVFTYVDEFSSFHP